MSAWSAQAMCLTVPVSACVTTPFTTSTNITSMDAASIPGYNRKLMNDFPRIAVSDASGTVSIVWNDARQHASGDIFLQSFNLTTLTPVQAAPVRVNPVVSQTEWHFLPALRNVNSAGRLNVSYFDQHDDATCTSCTDVFAVFNLNPRTTTSGSSVGVTNVTSNWVGTASDITPNFGDSERPEWRAHSYRCASKGFGKPRDGRPTRPRRA